MTREKLEKRVADLTKERERILGIARLIEGSIMDCNYWLAQLEKVDDIARRGVVEAAHGNGNGGETTPA